MIAIFILTVLLVAIAALLCCLRGFSRTLKEQKLVGILVRSVEVTQIVEPVQRADGNVEIRSRMSKNRPNLIAPDFHRQISQKQERYKPHHPADVA